ncbi:MAG: ribonuclease III, partial [Deltaproteobacteria bacterium]|nr:ribonuclease III [Deltaproteobacteria bacterium]
VQKHAHQLISKVKHEGVYKDYKTQLQETSQNLFKTVPRYRLVDEVGPDHDKTFSVNITINNEVFGTGSGKSKKDAEQNAACMALENISRKNQQEPNVI